MNNLILIAYCIFNAVGIVLYAWLSIVLLEIVLCRDVKQGNTTKLFSKRLTLRLRLFKRSLGNMFYRGTFCVWIASYIIIVIRLQELTGGILPHTDTLRPVVTMLLPYGIISLYRGFGYQSTLFTKQA